MKSRRSSSARSPSVRASARNTCASPAARRDAAVARAARARRKWFAIRLLGRGRRRRERLARSRRRLARRPAPRHVSDPAQARLRRHGRRVSRRARGRGIPAAGRDQAGPQRRVLAPGARPAAHGAADPGDAAAPEHRATARRRARAGRHALPRHGVHRRRTDRRLLRPAATVAGRTDRAGAHSVLGRALRAPEPDRASRPEAEQHPDHAARRAEAAGFRHREAARHTSVGDRRSRSRMPSTAS